MLTLVVPNESFVISSWTNCTYSKIVVLLCILSTENTKSSLLFHVDTQCRALVWNGIDVLILWLFGKKGICYYTKRVVHCTRLLLIHMQERIRYITLYVTNFNIIICSKIINYSPMISLMLFLEYHALQTSCTVGWCHHQAAHPMVM